MENTEGQQLGPSNRFPTAGDWGLCFHGCSHQDQSSYIKPVQLFLAHSINTGDILRVLSLSHSSSSTVLSKWGWSGPIQDHLPHNHPGNLGQVAGPNLDTLNENLQGWAQDSAVPVGASEDCIHTRTTSLLLILTIAISILLVRKSKLREASGLGSTDQRAKEMKWHVLEGKDRELQDSKILVWIPQPQHLAQCLPHS